MLFMSENKSKHWRLLPNEFWLWWNCTSVWINFYTQNATNSSHIRSSNYDMTFIFLGSEIGDDVRCAKLNGKSACGGWFSLCLSRFQTGLFPLDVFFFLQLNQSNCDLLRDFKIFNQKWLWPPKSGHENL